MTDVFAQGAGPAALGVQNDGQRQDVSDCPASGMMSAAESWILPPLSRAPIYCWSAKKPSRDSIVITGALTPAGITLAR